MRLAIAPLTQLRAKATYKRTLVIALCQLAVFINVALPKGGFYLGAIPITWGYIMLGLAAFTVTVYLLFNHYRINFYEGLQVLFLIIFLIYNLACLIFVGSAFDTIAEPISYLISIFVVPVFSILAVGYLAKRRGVGAIVDSWEPALWIIFIWGIVTFISYNLFKDLPPAGIPFLTLTGDNPADLLNRHIDRGVVVKMVSTYNNGNILGSNILMWLPLFLYGGRMRFKKLGLIARICIFLTFSRAAWFGLIIMEVLCLVFYRKKLRLLVMGAIAIPILFLVILLVAGIWFEDPLGFIFNPNLGGRVDNFATLPLFSLIPERFASVGEIIYLSLMGNLGAFGTLIFYVTWFSPLLVPVKSRELKLAKIGLATYFFVSFMEGAFIYIPTQFTYWMIAAFILSRATWEPQTKHPSLDATVVTN